MTDTSAYDKAKLDKGLVMTELIKKLYLAILAVVAPKRYIKRIIKELEIQHPLVVPKHPAPMYEPPSREEVLQFIDAHSDWWRPTCVRADRRYEIVHDIDTLEVKNGDR
jgi:hypothetical protein